MITTIGREEVLSGMGLLGVGGLSQHGIEK